MHTCLTPGDVFPIIPGNIRKLGFAKPLGASEAIVALMSIRKFILSDRLKSAALLLRFFPLW
jgi:hypothetical protein